MSLHGDRLTEVGARRRLQERSDGSSSVLKLDGADVELDEARGRAGAWPRGVAEEVGFEHGAEIGIENRDARVDAVVDER